MFAICFDLAQNVVFVLHVFVDLELFCLLDQHLFFLDVAEELVPLPLSLALHVPQVVFEPVVRVFAHLALALVRVLALLFHVGVDGVGALGVHHDWVAGVVGVAIIFTIQRLRNNVVQLRVSMLVKCPLRRDPCFVKIKVDIKRIRHDPVRFILNSRRAVLVNVRVAHVLHPR